MAKEKDFYKRLGEHYLEKTNYPAIEVKITKTNRFPYKSLPPHQERALVNKWFYKIPDVGLAQKPLDIVFKRTMAPVVIVFYKPRNSEIIEIPGDVFLREKYTSGDKSLHISRARELGINVWIGG